MSEWKSIPIKYLSTCNDEVLTENTDPNFEFCYIDIGSVNDKEGIAKREKMKFCDSPSRARRIVRENDVIVSTVRTYLRAIAQIPAFNEHQIVSTGFAVLRPRTINSTFFKYALLSDAFLDQVVSHSVGISYPAITSSEIGSFKIMVPDSGTQGLIASYLDQKITSIDVLISEAKTSIEEYKAWKASIIYEAVTKGLDKDVEMKDSGVEWIGKIPFDWKVCKTLYGLSMPITDGPHTTPELFDEGVPFVSAEAVSCGNGKIDFSHIRGFISEEFYQECCLKYVPQINDIYMIKSGATTGRVSYVDTDDKFTIWSPLAVFRVDEKRMFFKYLFFFLQSDAYQKQVQLGWTYGTQQNIGMRTLETLKICMPPVSEQKEIADYLDAKCGSIDALISEKESLISDFEAYKKSLIFEVVTGKRKVV